MYDIVRVQNFESLLYTVISYINLIYPEFL